MDIRIPKNVTLEVLMKKISYWLRPKLMIPAFGVSLTFAIIGKYLSPMVYTAGSEGKTSSSTVLLGTGVAIAAIILALFLLSLFLENVKTLTGGEKKPVKKAFGGIVCLIGLLIIGFFFISLLYGLLAVLIHAILKSTLSFEQIKGVVNIITVVLTWLLSPLLFNCLFSFGLHKVKLLKSCQTGVKIPAGRYIKFLIFPVVVFAAGWLTALPFRYLGKTVPIQLIQTVFVAILGMFALVFMTALYVESSNTKIVTEKDTEQSPDIKPKEEKETVTV